MGPIGPRPLALGEALSGEVDVVIAIQRPNKRERDYGSSKEALMEHKGNLMVIASEPNMANEVPHVRYL